MTREELLQQMADLLSAYEKDGHEVFVEFVECGDDNIHIYTGSGFRADPCQDFEYGDEDDEDDEYDEDDCSSCSGCCGNCCGDDDDGNDPSTLN